MIDAPLRRRLVALLWLCFLARGLYYAGAIPLWEGVDEFAAFGSIHAVADGDLIPGPSRKLSREIDESLKFVPMPRSFVAHPAITHDDFWKLEPAERDRLTAELRAIPESRQGQPGTQHLQPLPKAPLYAWIMAPAYSLARSWQLLNRVFLLRILNVLMASIALPLAYLLARIFLETDAAAICATAAFAAVPQMMFNISHIGSESLVLVLTTALAVAAVRFRTHRPVGMLIIVAVSALLIPLLLLPSPPPAVSGQTVLGAVLQMDWIRAADFAWHSQIWFGNASFLGLRSWVYDIMLLMFLVGLFGVARSWKRNGYPVLALLVLQAMFVAAIAWYGIAVFRATGNSLPPGWYLSALAASECALLVYGFRALSPAAMAIPGFLFATLDVYGSHVVLIPYYTGLISFSPTGRLAAFPLARWSYVVFDRLAFNKPEWLGSFTFSGLWAVYVIATCTLAGIAVWAAGVGRLDVWPSTE